MTDQTATHPTTTTATRAARLRTSLRLLPLGFALGIASMVALFVFGLVAGHVQLLVVASSLAAGLGASWVSTRTCIVTTLAEVER